MCCNIRIVRVTVCEPTACCTADSKLTCKKQEKKRNDHPQKYRSCVVDFQTTELKVLHKKLSRNQFCMLSTHVFSLIRSHRRLPSYTPTLRVSRLLSTSLQSSNSAEDKYPSNNDQITFVLCRTRLRVTRKGPIRKKHFLENRFSCPTSHVQTL